MSWTDVSAEWVAAIGKEHPDLDRSELEKLCRKDSPFNPRVFPFLLNLEQAHEASQGACMQAAWLEERANNEPDHHKRRELMRRAYLALEAAHRLRGNSA